MNESMGSPNPSRLMARMIVVAALIIIVIGVVFYRSLAALPFALGVLVTSGLNIIKIRMLAQTVEKVINMDDQEAGKNVVRLRYLLRYFLTGIVLVAIGLIHTYTSPPPIYRSSDSYLAVWATLFPNAPEALLNAPFISIWGALVGLFTLQISVIIVRSLKLEKDGENFIEYVDDTDEDDDNGDEVTDERDETQEKGDETHDS